MTQGLTQELSTLYKEIILNHVFWFVYFLIFVKIQKFSDFWYADFCKKYLTRPQFFKDFHSTKFCPLPEPR